MVLPTAVPVSARVTRRPPTEVPIHSPHAALGATPRLSSQDVAIQGPSSSLQPVILTVAPLAVSPRALGADARTSDVRDTRGAGAVRESQVVTTNRV